MLYLSVNSDFSRNDFDRDFVEFNAKIGELEGRLQLYINRWGCVVQASKYTPSSMHVLCMWCMLSPAVAITGCMQDM